MAPFVPTGKIPVPLPAVALIVNSIVYSNNDVFKG